MPIGSGRRSSEADFEAIFVFRTKVMRGEGYRPAVLLVPALLLFAAFAPHGTWHYDLDHPDRRITLPAELLEVSALTDIDVRTVACVQDEQGAVYMIDINSGKVTGKSVFAAPGDYEGLTRVGDRLYALRSDGLIHRLKKAGGAYIQEDTFRLKVSNQNIEGLGFDERTQVMLIAAKDNLKGDKAVRDERFIYGWDLLTDRQLPEPVLTLSVERIAGQARAIGVKLPVRRTPKGVERVDFKLRPSSIAMHPIEDRYYLLSAQDHALLVLDRQGVLRELFFLDPVLFPKPEGITFQADGTLLISNEGKGAPPNLLLFKMKA